MSQLEFLFNKYLVFSLQLMVIKVSFEIFDPSTYIKLKMWLFTNKSMIELQSNIEVLG